MYWLGLDVGTSGSRALLVDARGRVRHSFTAAHEDMRMPKPLWAEQDPDDWWRASEAAIRGVLKEAQIDSRDIAAVGLSGQMHGLVLLDRNQNVIRPALIWCDQRSQAQVDFVNSKLGRDQLVAWTANPVLTGFTLPKLLWVRDNESDAFASVRKILLPKDYIRFKLTGDFATDVSDASGTALFDVVHRTWSEPVLLGLEIDRNILPQAHESSEITGTVTQGAAESTGLRAGTPVIAGAGDQAASAIGNGIVESGTASCTIGTSGVVFSFLAEPAYDPAGRVHTFCHAIPGAWHVMGVTQGAGLSLQWFRNRFEPNKTYGDLSAEAELAPPGANGLFWLPYLMGERTPHLDANARSAWIGITAIHQRSDLIRAVLEGVCFSQNDALEIISALGARPSAIRLSGGGARSAFWHQMFADVFNQRVVTLETQEGSAYGVALLSMVATGEYASIREICRIAIKEVDAKTPREPVARLYRNHYRVYRSLYPALRDTFRVIGHLDA